MKKKNLQPGGELEEILREASKSVEDSLKLEDEGWQNLSGATGEIISSSDRITNLKLSRLYALKDPLAKQAIRLWTDYTFGTGMTWSTEDERAKETLSAFWDNKINRPVLSAQGQRKSSNKLLIDGEVFFALFLGTGATIRTIDPLEITEIITDTDDKDTPMYYRRQWTDAQGTMQDTIYRSLGNIKGIAARNMYNKDIAQAEGALVYHFTINTISQRGNPLLLPALDWIKQYRRFLASRIAVVLALARFAWVSKVKGGSTAVSAIKAKTDDKEVAAGSNLIENMGVDTTPIKTESGASAAYQDGRMIKLQIAAAVGIPEQYFGDISIGNLATAKTVELPMMKMFQSYQAIWSDAYQDIDEAILEHAGIPPDKWYIDRDFPKIAPADVAAAATAITQILQVLPALGDSEDVKQIALMIMGINDPQEVLDQLAQEAKRNPSIALTKALRDFRESIKGEK